MRSQIQKDPRIKRRLSCDLFFNGGRHAGIALNVSRGGLFVQTSIAAQPGADVAIDLNGPSGANLEVDARVVWKRVVQGGLRGVDHGGVGFVIKRASGSYYEFLERISESDTPPEAAAPLSRYHVRAHLHGTPRSRSLTVFAESEDEARDQVLQKLGDNWSVIDLKERRTD